MDIDSCYQLGYVTKPHGLKGDLSIVIDADYPESYQHLESVFIEIDGQLIPFFISSININGPKGLMNLEEVTSLAEAQTLKGARLFLPLSSLPKLAADQFYFHEIIDFEVEDVVRGILGNISAVYDIGPQDIIAFQYKGQEIMLPINDETIVGVDKESKRLRVVVPDGLLDIYLDNQEP